MYKTVFYFIIIGLNLYLIAEADEIISNSLASDSKSVAILLPTDKTCNTNGCFKIVNNKVFQEGTLGSPLGELKDAKELLVHNNYLWATGKSGDLWIWTPISKCWIHIDNSVEKIRSDNKTFFIIKNNGDLSTYVKGDVIFTRVEDAKTYATECFVVTGFLTPSPQVMVKDIISENSVTMLLHKNDVKRSFYEHHRVPASDYYKIFTPAKEYLGTIPKSE